MAGKAGEPGALPKIVRDGTNNGFFVHSRSLWWQNEDTAKLPNLVDRRSFNDLLKDVEPRGKSPEASLRSIRVEPGFTVELAATEPLVKDPIAFDWGADGRLWVLEMGDYPARAPTGKGSRAASSASSRMPTATAGTTSRRRSSTASASRRASCPGETASWSPAHRTSSTPRTATATARPIIARCSSPASPRATSSIGSTASRWASTAGSTAPTATAAGLSARSRPASRSRISGRDFRFRPDTGEFEAESGQTQYGRHRDDWGRLVRQQQSQLGLALSSSRSRTCGATRIMPPPTPGTRSSPRRGSIRSAGRWPRFNDPGMANHVTSANSPTPYRDELFGPWFATSLFVSEPVHNLVHRMVLEPDGVTFRGRRGPNGSGREFLASSDNWFRPTMLKTGPDGALWIADMYRAVIEHPEWIPDDWEKRLDLRAGSEQGRIYRVYPVDRKPRPIPRLDRLDEAGLVAALDSPSGWQRDTAQRLLLHRGGIEGRRAAAIAGRAHEAAADAGCRRSGRSPTSAAWTKSSAPRRADRRRSAGPRGDRRGGRAAAARLVTGRRGGAAAGRRSRGPGPVPRGAAAGQLGRPSRGRGAGEAGASRWQRSLDARGHPLLGDAPRAGAAGGPAGRRRRGGRRPRSSSRCWRWPARCRAG